MTDIVAAHRKLDAEFLDALEALAAAPTPNWWQDVLRNDDLFIAVRRNSLNVYYRAPPSSRSIGSMGASFLPPISNIWSGRPRPTFP